MRIMRAATPVEKSVFRLLDTLNSEGKTNYKEAIKRKWPDITNREIKDLIKWWNINQNEHGDYNNIITVDLN